MIKLELVKTLHTSVGIRKMEINTTIKMGSLTAVVGPSGAGKTTLLRLLAGLTKPDHGFIQVEQKTWLDTQKRYVLPIRSRSIGMVFQDYALFPNMTVRGNLEYALSKKASRLTINDLMDTMDLIALQDRKPALLSGGQQQRVALARAIVQKPQILLLDEPLSALDRAMRNRLQDYILLAHQQFGLTTILVSHDLEEVVKLADQVMLLEEGQLIKYGSPQALWPERKGQLIELKAKVLEVIQKNGQTKYSVLIGEDIVSLTREKSNEREVLVGSEILIRFNTREFQILDRKNTP